MYLKEFNSFFSLLNAHNYNNELADEFSESERLLLLKGVCGNELKTVCDRFPVLSSNQTTNTVQDINGNEKNLMADFKDGVDGRDDFKAFREPDLLRKSELLSAKKLLNNAIISHKLKCISQFQFSPKKECMSNNKINVQMKDVSNQFDTSVKKNTGCVYKKSHNYDRHRKKIRLLCSHLSDLRKKPDIRKSLLLSSNINQFQGIKFVEKKSPEDLSIDFSGNKEIEKNKYSVASFQDGRSLYCSRSGSNTSHYCTKSKIPVRIKNKDFSEKIFLKNAKVGSLTEKWKNNFLTCCKLRNITSQFVTTHCFSDKLEVVPVVLDENAHESENLKNVDQNFLNVEPGKCIVCETDSFQEKINFVLRDELTERDSKHGKHSLVKYGSEIDADKPVFSNKIQVQGLNCNNKMRSTLYRFSNDNTNNFDKINSVQVSDNIQSEKSLQGTDSDCNNQTIEEISYTNTKSSKLLKVHNKNKIPDVFLNEARILEKRKSSVKLSVEHSVDFEELIENDELQSSYESGQGKNMKALNNFDMNSKYFIGFKSKETNDCSKGKHFIDSSSKSVRSEQSTLSCTGNSLESTCYGKKQNELVNSEVHANLEKVQLSESIKPFPEGKDNNLYKKMMLRDKSKLNNRGLITGELLKQSIPDDEHLLGEELKSNESVPLDGKLSPLIKKDDGNMKTQNVKTKTSQKNIYQHSSGLKWNRKELAEKKTMNLVHSFSSTNSDDVPVVTPENLENCSPYCCEQLCLMNKTKCHKSGAQSAVFKIFINDLQLTSKSIDHLRKIDSNPQIFLTWKFLDLEDNAYSSLQPAEEAVFQSSSEYHGPFTPEVLQYMAKCNVCIDCYLKLKGGSYRLARGEFNVASAIYQPQQKFIPKILLNGEFVEGTLHCWCLMNFSTSSEKNLDKHCDIPIKSCTC